jgi:hypothetical protein
MVEDKEIKHISNVKMDFYEPVKYLSEKSYGMVSEKVRVCIKLENVEKYGEEKVNKQLISVFIFNNLWY